VRCADPRAKDTIAISVPSVQCRNRDVMKKLNEVCASHPLVNKKKKVSFAYCRLHSIMDEGQPFVKNQHLLEFPEFFPSTICECL
jgi:hypothetical protein